jgi:hypothetical protein
MNRSKSVALVLVVAVALMACDRGSTQSVTGLDTWAAATNQDGESYSDPAGWTVQVQPGWHVIPFETSKGAASVKGTQISNVTLPPPSIMPGYPIQVNGNDLPDDGIALIVAVDDEPSDVQQPPPSPPQPPLALDMFLQGSALAGSPTLDLLWFSGNGQTFLASIKSGPNASPSDQAALQHMVAALRFGSAAS